MLTNSLLQQDKDHVVHPMVSLRHHERRGATVIRSADGCFVTDIEGNTLLDGFAGLWCVNAGYGQQSLVDAASEQMSRLPYATQYFHYGSEPPIKLASRLIDLAPASLDHVFFTLGGSDAIDTVIRLIRYHSNALGQPNRKHIIALERGFHGSSSNGSGLTGLPVFHDKFDVPTPQQHHIPCPDPYRHPSGPDGQAIIDASVAALQAKVEALGKENVAAFFCELVMGSGGVVVPPDGFATTMQAACRDLGILFVVDEVITGFGRTGPLFACEHEGIEPDFMTVAKGLTSGYAPMGAAMMSDEVYQVLADAVPDGTPLGHGLTYSGHPVSAAVGLAALDLYQGSLVQNGTKVGEYFGKRLREFEGHSLVGHVRSKGLLAAIEVVADKSTKEKFAARSGIGNILGAVGYKNDLIFRAFADGIMAFAPPICISEDEVDILIDRIARTLNTVEKELS
ncbi:aminotransferase class III-fold pyridoxal phosphate-dependent enzyme [Gymnodinialimonas sp. 2305UL16-5]|uniref:aminotransferase class III-fold pyridoxal phosphate-dependent enzyme n=1 Tax=Gymnodinialimonas mytili TaxID=3126503 RepID=UPI0030AA33BD